MAVNLTHSNDVYVLSLGDDENRMTTEWLATVNAALDEVEAAAPAALVTSAEGKFFSNGLDEARLGGSGDELTDYVTSVHAVLGRLLTLSVPTVAAINGHAFGAGAMVALAHDFRVMNADKGFFCFPEVDIKIPFTPPMAALIQAKLNPRAAMEAMTTGKRYTAQAALDAGIVDSITSAHESLAQAQALVSSLTGKDPRTLAAIKRVMFADAQQALSTRVAIKSLV